MQVLILEKILLNEGFAVHAFVKSEDLMRKLDEENRLPLIISDIDMPDMNGFQLMEHIQQKPCGKDIPFFFISSKKDSAMVEKAQKMGAKTFIEKPFETDSLIQLVRTVICVN